MNYEEAKRKIEIYCEHICIWDKDYCNNCENNVAIEALEKQIPKKPLHFIHTFENCCNDWEYDCCSVCGEEVREDYEGFCPTCGQAIDWSEVE